MGNIFFIEHDLRVEMEKLHALEKKVTDWKEEMEGDLAVNLRVTEKTESDRKQLMEENKNLVCKFQKIAGEE